MYQVILAYPVRAVRITPHARLPDQVGIQTCPHIFAMNSLGIVTCESSRAAGGLSGSVPFTVAPDDYRSAVKAAPDVKTAARQTYKRLRDDGDAADEQCTHCYNEKRDMATTDTLAALLLFNNLELGKLLGRETVVTHAAVAMRVRARIPELFFDIMLIQDPHLAATRPRLVVSTSGC
jgi:hypothetical protein